MAHHLTPEEREVIAQMRSAGRKQVEIARQLERAASTISRELQRNRSGNGYWAIAAQKKAEARRRQRPWVRKMERPEIRRYVQERFRQEWSPDQIAKRLRKDALGDRRRHVSHQTIYAWIAEEEAKGKRWRRYLRSAGWKQSGRDKRGRIPACTSIEGRPAVVRRLAAPDGTTVVVLGMESGAVAAWRVE